MSHRARTSVVVSALAVLGIGSAVPQAQRNPRVRQQPAAARPSAIQARISGSVITRDEPPRPVRRAKVRARDAAGRIVGTTTTDESGQFWFLLERAGTYYVELVDDTGRVLAVEDVGEAAISVGAGENSTTILRVPGRLPGAAAGNRRARDPGRGGRSGDRRVHGIRATGEPRALARSHLRLAAAVLLCASGVLALRQLQRVSVSDENWRLIRTPGGRRLM
jgi:hypothetical protein